MTPLSLVLIHGAGANHTYWPAELRTFKKINIINFDLPGHGRSKEEGYKTVEEYAIWIEKKLKNKKNIILCGHSLGGAIVQNIALKNPSWLKAIILIATGAKLKTNPFFLEQIKNNYPEAIEAMPQVMYGPDINPRFVELAKADLLKSSPQTVYNDFYACDQFNVMEQVNQIQCPALIINGSLDQMTPIKYGQYLHQQIKNSQLVEIKNAGHNVHLEKPKEVVCEIKKFLSQNWTAPC